MERQFYNEDFEKTLRDNANQYRMYPSEKVWKGIYSSMHPERRWYGPAALGLLLLTGIIISVAVLNSKPNNQVNTEKRPPSTISSQNKNGLSFGITRNELTIEPQKFPIVFKPNLNSSSTNNQFGTHINKTSLSLQTDRKALTPDSRPDANASETKADVINNNNEEILAMLPIDEINTKVNHEFIRHENNTIRKSAYEPSMDDNTTKKLSESIEAIASQNIPITNPRKQSRFWTQYFISPTFSYRKLSGNKPPTASGAYSYSPIIDVNQAVKHKPELGFEFGMDGMYQLTNRFLLKSGIQFNINRYDIRAYSHTTEIATVAVRSGYSTYSLARPTNYSNFTGSAQNWLQNSYFQVAIPIGADLVLTDNNKVSWRIGGSIQPTYVIGETAYLLSNDFRNYAEFPDLMRRWNVSTGFGTSIGYATGGVDWQMGPQVRYQLLSSYISGYPVKENLFSVGFKVAASFNKSK